MPPVPPHLVDRKTVARADLEIGLVEHAHQLAEVAAAHHARCPSSRPWARSCGRTILPSSTCQVLSWPPLTVDREAVAAQKAPAANVGHRREVVEEFYRRIVDREVERQVFVGQEALRVGARRPVHRENTALVALPSGMCVFTQLRAPVTEIYRPEGHHLLRRDSRPSPVALTLHADLPRLRRPVEPDLAGSRRDQFAGHAP